MASRRSSEDPSALSTSARTIRTRTRRSHVLLQAGALPPSTKGGAADDACAHAAAIMDGAKVTLASHIDRDRSEASFARTGVAVSVAAAETASGKLATAEKAGVRLETTCANYYTARCGPDSLCPQQIDLGQCAQLRHQGAAAQRVHILCGKADRVGAAHHHRLGRG